MDTGACAGPDEGIVELADGYKMVTFRAPRELVRRLDDAAGDTKAGRSGLIREACERLLGDR